MVNGAINGNGRVVRKANLPTSRQALGDYSVPFDGPVKTVVE